MEEIEYITVGPKNIYLELQKDITCRLNNYNLKPRGGLWATRLYHYNSYVCEWLEHIREHEEAAFNRNLEDAVIYKLKKDAKICLLNTKAQIIDISQKYSSLYHRLTFMGNVDEDYLIDYYLLSLDYDAIFMDYQYTNKAETKKYNLGCSSINVCNPLIIEKYQPISLKRDYRFNTFNIEEIKPSQVIEPLSPDYLILEEEAKEFFKRNMPFKIGDFENYLFNIIKTLEVLRLHLKEFHTEEIIKIIDKREGLYVNDIIETICFNTANRVLSQDLKELYKEFLINNSINIKTIDYEELVYKKTKL